MLITQQERSEMAVSIHQKKFLDVIQKAFPVVPNKSSLQILVNFKLIFTRTMLEIEATDLDFSIKVQTEIESDKEFEIAVNAKKLFEIVKELHNDFLSLDVDNNVLIIESGGSFSCKIAGVDTKDFPLFPELKDVQELVINSQILNNMIQKSSFAVSKDESRGCLCGVLWEVENNKSGMVSTDGHRLGSSFINAAFNVEEKIANIISQKTLIQLLRLISAEEKTIDVTVHFGSKNVFFTHNNFTLCSKLIDGPYPEYRKVIPENNPKIAVLDKNSLLEAVRRVSVLSNQKTHLVKFAFSKNSLEIGVLNRDIGGEAKQVINIAYDGEEHSMGVNASFFSEILGIVETSEIRIEMDTSISACLIYPCFDDENDKKSDDLFLIMPLRIYDE